MGLWEWQLNSPLLVRAGWGRPDCRGALRRLWLVRRCVAVGSGVGVQEAHTPVPILAASGPGSLNPVLRAALLLQFHFILGTVPFSRGEA